MYYVLVEIETSDCHLTTVILVLSLYYLSLLLSNKSNYSDILIGSHSVRMIYWKTDTYFVILDSMLTCVCSVTDHVFLMLFSDPYARVVFGTQSQVTEILTSTICPTWDQTLIFENVQIYGSIDKVARHPPEIIIELFDKDPVVSQFLT